MGSKKSQQIKLSYPAILLSKCQLIKKTKHDFGQLLVTLMRCQYVCDIICCFALFPMVFEKFPVQRVPCCLDSVPFFWLQYLKPLVWFMCIVWLAWWKILNSCLAAVFRMKVGFCGCKRDSTHAVSRTLVDKCCTFSKQYSRFIAFHFMNYILQQLMYRIHTQITRKINHNGTWSATAMPQSPRHLTGKNIYAQNGNSAKPIQV